MMARCVVLVDGGYIRDTAALVLGAGPDGRAVVQNANDLADALRDIAEETSGQDLLRVYWYEPPQHEDDTALLRAAPFVTVRRNHVRGRDATIAEDLLALLAHVQTGDVLICTDDDALRDIMDVAQKQGRHVHLLQIGGAHSIEPSTALRDVSDTCRWLPAESVASAFRLGAATASSRVLGHAATVQASTPAADSSTSPAPRQTAGTEPDPRAGSGPADGASDAAVPTRLSVNRQEQSVYLAARLREITASHARPHKSPAVQGQDGSTSNSPVAGNTSVGHDVSDRQLTRFEPPRPASRGDAGFTRDGSRTSHDIPSELTARLRDIAEDIADEIELPDAATLRTWEYGIPAHVDRQLLGASHSTLGMLLDSAQKSQLRRLFREACLSRITE